MTTPAPEWLVDLTAYYAVKYDRSYSVVDEADARAGWKCYSAEDGGYHRGGTGGVCRPLLGGLCIATTYKASVDHARCAGIPHEKRWTTRDLREHRVNSKRFTPCKPAASWGCPARCGLYSNVFMAESRHGASIAAMALTSSWGQVIRCDSGIGEAWRAQTIRIEHLFLAEKFATLRTEGDARRGFAERYGCPVDVVPADQDTHRDGRQPVASFVVVAGELGLPALHRPDAA